MGMNWVQILSMRNSLNTQTFGKKTCATDFGHVNISVIFLMEHMWIWQHCWLIKFARITQDLRVLLSLDLAVCVCKEKCKIECQPYSLV